MGWSIEYKTPPLKGLEFKSDLTDYARKLGFFNPWQTFCKKSSIGHVLAGSD